MYNLSVKDLKEHILRYYRKWLGLSSDVVFYLCPCPIGESMERVVSNVYLSLVITFGLFYTRATTSDTVVVR